MAYSVEFKTTDNATYNITSDRKLNKKEVTNFIRENIKFIKLGTGEKPATFTVHGNTITIQPISQEKHVVDKPALYLKETEGVFSTIYNGFSRFINWVFRRPVQEPLKQAELAFAMNLFRNADTSIFAHLGDSSKTDLLNQFQNTRLPMSQVLSIWENFLESMKDYAPDEKGEMDELLPQIKQLRQFQEEIERIRLISNKKDRVKARDKLREEISNKWVEARDNSKSFFMPGGYIDPKTGEVQTMIYEIFEDKDDPSKVKFRIIDLSGSFITQTEQENEPQEAKNAKKPSLDQVQKLAGLNPKEIKSTATFTIKQAGWDTVLEQSVNVQVGPPHFLFQQKLSKFQALKQMIFGQSVDELGGADRKDLLKEMIAGQLSEETVGDHSTKQRSLLQVSSEKIFEVFLKTTQKELYPKKKALLKASIFLFLYEKAKGQLSHSEVRGWLRNNAISLIESLQKFEKVQTGQEDTGSIQNRLKVILNELNKFEEANAIKLADDPARQKVQEKSFSEALKPSHNLVKTSEIKIKEIESKTAAAVSLISFRGPDNRFVAEPPLNEFKALIVELKGLAAKGDFKTLELKLQDSFHLLAQVTKEGYWEYGNLLNKKYREDWCDVIKDLSLLNAQTHFSTMRLAPEPHYIFNMLKGLEITDRLMRLNLNSDDINAMKLAQKMYFDTAPIEQVLRDSYLNLGDYAADIHETLSYLRSPPKLQGYFRHKVRLMSANPNVLTNHSYDEFPTGDAELLNELVPENNSDQRKKYAQDVGQHGLFPREVADMRQIYMVTTAMLQPSHTLITHGFGSLLGTGLNILEEVQLGGVLAGEVNPFTKTYQASLKEVERRLKEKKGEIKISCETSRFGYGGQFILEPWGLAIADFYDPVYFGSVTHRFDFKHPDHYKENGAQAPSLQSQEALFEQVVGKEDHSFVNDEGEKVKNRGPYNRANLEKRKYGVAGKTQVSILRDKLTFFGLSSDTIEDLMLMNTGDKTRIKETMGKLTMHAGLLNDHEVGPLLQRLFERNLFRNGLIIEQLIADPQYANEMVNLLKNIATSMKDSGKYNSYLFVLQLMEEVNLCLNTVESQIKVDDEKDLIKTAQDNLNKAIEENFKLLEDFKKHADDKKQPFVQYRRDFHYNFLLHQERLLHDQLKGSLETPTLSDATLMKIVYSYTVIKASNQEEDPTKERAVRYLMHRLSPLLEDRLLIEGFVQDLGKSISGSKDGNWTVSRKDHLVIQQGNRQIDLRRGFIWTDGERVGTLPGEFLRHPDYNKVNEALGAYQKGLDLSKIDVSIKNVEVNKAIGSQYTFTLGDEGKPKIECKIVIMADGRLSLYKRQPKSRWFHSQPAWYQYTPNLTSTGSRKGKGKQVLGAVLGDGHKTPFPKNLEKYNCWISEDQKVIQFEEGATPVFVGALKKPLSIASLKEVSTKKDVLNPWDDASFNHFKDMEDIAHITALGGKGHVNEVRYNRFKLSYEWDSTQKAWKSKDFSNYYLSSKTLSQCFERETPDEETSAVEKDASALRNLFSNTFTHYHLLENPNALLQVVLAGNEYIPFDPTKDAAIAHLKKNTRSFVPKYDPDKKDAVPLFVYKADPNKGLVSEDVPDGYLYLAYTLLTQGKYQEAIRYLQKADINRPLSEFGSQVVGWMQANRDQSPEAKAFRMHLTLIQMRQAMYLGSKAAQTDLSQKMTLMAALQHSEYRKLVNEGKIHEGIQLTPKEREEFKRFCERSLYYVGYKMAKHKDALLKLGTEFAEVKKELDQAKYKDDPVAYMEQKIQSLTKLEQESKEFGKLMKTLFDKLHFTMSELYSWYEAGFFEKLADANFNLEQIIDTVIEYENKSQLRLKSSLKEDIKAMQAQILQNKAALERTPQVVQNVESKPTVLFPKAVQNQINSYFEDKRLSAAAQADWNKKITDFKKAVSGNPQAEQSYAEEMGGELVEDLAFQLEQAGIDVHASRSHLELIDNKEDKLKSDIDESLRKILEKNKKAKEDLLSHLRPKKGEGSDLWLTFIKDSIDKYPDVDSALLELAKDCYSSNNWDKIAKFSMNKKFSIPNTEKLFLTMRQTDAQIRALQEAKAIIQSIEKGEKEGPEYQAKVNDLYHMLTATYRFREKDQPQSVFSPPSEASPLAFYPKEYFRSVQEAPIPFYRKELKLQEVGQLEEDVAALHKDVKEVARRYKLQVLNLLPQAKKSEGWQDLLDQCKERNVSWQETLFDTALRCFGEEDWAPIEELAGKPFSDKEKETFDQAITEYLKAAVKGQQLTRAQEAIENVKKVAPNEKEEYAKKSQELYLILSQQWQYDPNKDPDRHSILLIEYDLNLICFRSQVNVIRASLKDDNLFKQEICGGGKTSVLRNIIAHRRANGVNLSGVSTLDPLRQEHGPQFSRTTHLAYGEKSLDFKFERGSPSDETSLLKLHRNLLSMIVNRGRIDLTKGDLLSFKLEEKLKQDQIEQLRKLNNDKAKADIDRLNREIDVMEDIRDLLLDSGYINADELDKDCDAKQEKNYGYGDRQNLNQDKIEAALTLFTLMLNAEDIDSPYEGLKKIIQGIKNNQQNELKGFELAKDLFSIYQTKLGLSKDQELSFIDYLTETASSSQNQEVFSQDVERFYKDFIQIKDDDSDEKKLAKTQIAYMHEFIAQILPSALTKKGGVRFGRSEDGIHVIPFEGSDKPKEGSEHSLESERIIYTCIDYLDTTRDGISEIQILQLVESEQKKAQQEMEISRRVNPDHPISFAETEAAKKFQASFEEPLDQVNSESIKRICVKLYAPSENGEHPIINFLRDWVFPEYFMNTEKIVSDSQDPPSMVKSYSGSAGTDGAKYALPDKIDVTDVRQKGVHGQILKAMIEIDAQNEAKGIASFVEAEGKEESGQIVLDADTFAKQLAQTIKGGDCLSDVGVFFPGISAEDIARNVQKAHKAHLEQMKLENPEENKNQKQLVIRFINRENEWKMLMPDGSIQKPSKSIPLDQVFTIFDDTHTRGAERPSKDGVTEYVTLTEKVAWSAFEQAILRERGVTKGKANIVYFISPALWDYWKGKADLNKLQALLDHNEAEEVKILNFKAEKQKIKAIPRHQVEIALRAMSKESRETGGIAHHAARELIHKHMRAYFIRPTTTSAESAGQPKGQITGGKALQLAVEKEEKDLQTYLTNLSRETQSQPQHIKDSVHLFIKNMLEVSKKLQAKKSTEAVTGGHKPRIADKYIPAHIAGNADEVDNEQSVEQEQEQEQAQEMQQEQQQESQSEGARTLAALPFVSTHLYAGELVEVLTATEGDEDEIPTNMYRLKVYNKLQPGNIYFTEDFSSVERAKDRKVQPWGIMKERDKLPPDQNKISRVLLTLDRRNTKAGGLIGSLKNNDVDIEEFLSSSTAKNAANNNIYYFMYNVETDSIDGGFRPEDLEPKEIEKLQEVIIGIKFQNGNVNYMDLKDASDLQNQFQALVKWLAKADDLNATEKSFTKFITQNRINNQYDGSDIQRAFREARKLQKSH